MTDLPNGWRMVSLADCGTARSGRSTPDRDDDRPYLSLEDIESNTTRVAEWRRAGDFRSSSAEIRRGDLVYARLRPYLNKVCLSDRDGVGSAELIVIEPAPAVEPRFLLMVMNSSEFVRFASRLSDGDRPRVKWEQIAKYPVRLPPLSEQRRILAALDASASRIEAAEHSLRSAERRLHLLRDGAWASVHDATWPRRALSDVLLPSAGKVLQQGWSPRCLKEPSDDETSWGLLRTTAVQMGTFVESENKRLPPSLSPRPHLEVTHGDLLMTSGGPRSRIGVTCFVETPRARLILSDKMFRFRPDPGRVDPAFLLSFLTSTTGLQLIEPLKTGSNDSGLRISQAAFLGLEVPVPSLKEQHDVVGRLAAVSSQVDRVRSEVDRARSRAVALSHSLRSSALSGRLLGAGEQLASPIEHLEAQ